MLLTDFVKFQRLLFGNCYSAGLQYSAAESIEETNSYHTP